MQRAQKKAEPEPPSQNSGNNSPEKNRRKKTGTVPLFRTFERFSVRSDFFHDRIFAMPRVSRFVLQDVVHHVVARGVNRQPIFSSGFDKAKYLKRFAKVADEEKVLVHGYCLMDNHVHWLLTPTSPNGLARLIQRVHTWWAMVFNRRHDRVGHLFQSRFQSSALGESHYWSALRYVELNPKKARPVRQAEDWEFSSARSHTTGKPDAQITLVPVITRKRFSPRDWVQFLKTPTEFETTAALRSATKINRPCGEQAWIRRLETKHRRVLISRPPGRPAQNYPMLTAS